MARNSEGQNLMVVDIAIEKEMDVLNTFVKKSDQHRETYTSGCRSAQVDYARCRRAYIKHIGYCKLVCLWSGGGDVQRRSEGAILRVCRYEGSLRQGTKRGGVALHGEG